MTTSWPQLQPSRKHETYIGDIMCKSLGFFLFVTFPSNCSSEKNGDTFFQWRKLSCLGGEASSSPPPLDETLLSFSLSPFLSLSLSLYPLIRVSFLGIKVPKESSHRPTTIQSFVVKMFPSRDFLRLFPAQKVLSAEILNFTVCAIWYCTKKVE